MSCVRTSPLGTNDFTFLGEFADDCRCEMTRSTELFTATSLKLRPHTVTNIRFDSMINLLMVVSGKVSVIDGFDGLELISGDIWLVDEQDDFSISNTNEQFDADIIKVEMNQAMVARFNHRYDEALIKRQEQTDFVEAFTCKQSNRTVFESCHLSRLALEAFQQFVREDDKGLYILKMEELLLLKLKSKKGNHLAFHILNRCDPVKEKYRNFIEHNVLNDWSLAIYAKNLGMSLTSFKVMFKQVYTDSSPKSWINERRLRHANKLLRTTRKRLIDIAMESGFSSQSYFTQSYKARFGCCPSDIRNKKNALKRV